MKQFSLWFYRLWPIPNKWEVLEDTFLCLKEQFSDDLFFSTCSPFLTLPLG